MSAATNLPVIDDSQSSAAAAIEMLRQRLAVDGDVVSEAGRQRTIAVFGEPLTPQQVVERICREVREEGREAALRYGASLDGADLTAKSWRVSADELAEAHANADAEYLGSIRRIAANVRRFQEAIRVQDKSIPVAEGGGWLRQRYVPLRRVGICIPGGAAAYPSSLLMTVIPAQVAGVEEIVVVAPPTKFGSNNPHLLAACREVGVKNVYRVGGAQGVAALAYGVEGLPRVDKIVGPGNLFVALAKQFVFGQVDIDSIAGPSEVIILSDGTSNPAWVAADLIAQAEHAPGSSVLITWDRAFVGIVQEELSRQLASLGRAQEAAESLESFGAILLVENVQRAIELTDEFAPEHLHIQCENAADVAEQIRNAGATFVGPYTPVALGDYVAGPSHVLPTGGTARFAAGLCVNDFLRSGSVIHFDRSALQAHAEDLVRVSEIEGLTAHAASAEIRLKEDS